MSSSVDLSSMSDEELERLAAGARPKAVAPAPVPTVDVTGMSEAELEYTAKTGKRLPAYATGEAKARGAYQGFTSEFGDELAGGMQAAIDTVTSPFTGDPRSIPERYTEKRDELRARNARAREVDPVGYYGSEIVVGALSPTPLGKGTAVAQGLKYGALAGLGASEANPLENPGQTLMDTAGGAIVGSVAGKVVPAVAGAVAPLAKAAGRTAAEAARRVPGVKPVEDFARAGGEVAGDFFAGVGGGIQRSLERGLSREGRVEAANIQAAKAAGLQGIADSNRLGGMEAVDDVGKYLRESGIVNPRRLDRESIQREAELRLGTAGEEIGKIRQAMREAGIGPDTESLVGRIGQVQGELAKYRDLPQVAGLIKIGDDVSAALRANTDHYGQTRPEILDELKSLMDDELFKLGDTGNLQGRLSQPAQQMRQGIRELFRAEEERVADQLHPTIGENFRKAKFDYSNLKDVLYLAGRGDKRDLSNKAISLTDWTILGPAASSSPEGLVAGALAYGSKQVGERFGNAAAANALASPKMDAALALGPAAAQGAQKIGASAWGAILDRAQQQGERALAVTAAALIRSNPDARWEIIDEVERRRAEGGKLPGEDPTPGVSATLRPIPPTPSDARVKENVEGLDSKQVLRRYVQHQAPKRPSTNPTPISSSPAVPGEKRREAFRMVNEGGKLRSIEGARKRVTITRDRDGLPATLEIEEL